MKRALLLPALLVLLSLACGMAAPTQTAPIPTATARPIPTYSEPLDAVATRFDAQECKLEAMTDTNVRECASLACPITGDLILKGDIISAACNSLWAYVPKRGWVCVPALMQTGGCESPVNR